MIHYCKITAWLLQAWDTAFKTVPELREFHKTYQELKLKGVEFPPPDPEMAITLKKPSAKVLFFIMLGYKSLETF